MNYVTVWYIKCVNAWGAVVNYDDVGYATPVEALNAWALKPEALQACLWIESGQVERHVNNKIDWSL